MRNELPGNPYIKHFIDGFMDFGENAIAEEGITDATIIWQGITNQAHTYLALSHEQRTANLMQLMQWASSKGDVDAIMKLHPVIIERLGLND